MTSLDYIFITFENAPGDEDTVRHGLDLLFPLHEVFKNVTTGIYLAVVNISQFIIHNKTDVLLYMKIARPPGGVTRLVSPVRGSKLGWSLPQFGIQGAADDPSV